MSDVAPVPLCEVADVLALLTAEPATALEPLIDAASARFRAEAGTPITPATHRLILSAYGGEVTLPYTPVLAVADVRRVTDEGTPGAALTGWTFDGIDAVDLTNSYTGWLTHGHPRRVEVEWQAGYDPIPEDVRWTVAAMVTRAAEAGPSGVTAEQVGDYRRTFGAFTASGAMSMTRDERAIALRYRQRRSTLTVVAR